MPQTSSNTKDGKLTSNRITMEIRHCMFFSSTATGSNNFNSTILKPVKIVTVEELNKSNSTEGEFVDKTSMMWEWLQQWDNNIKVLFEHYRYAIQRSYDICKFSYHDFLFLERKVMLRNCSMSWKSQLLRIVSGTKNIMHKKWQS